MQSSQYQLCQVPLDDVLTIVYCDCTKFGVMSQPEINALAEFVEKTLFRSPYRLVPSIALERVLF